MNKTYALLASLALVASTSAFAADTTINASGTDAAGTSSSVKQTVSTDKHMNGNTDTTIKTKATNDPKGLFNKSKVKSKETVTTDKNGNVIKDKKTVNGKIVDDTTVSK